MLGNCHCIFSVSVRFLRKRKLYEVIPFRNVHFIIYHEYCVPCGFVFIRVPNYCYRFPYCRMDGIEGTHRRRRAGDVSIANKLSSRVN